MTDPWLQPGSWKADAGMTEVVHVCHTPMHEVLRKPDRVRWCFRCRAHLPHDFVVLATVEPSYYDPTPMYACSRCGEDHTLGFGMHREWFE